MVGHSMGGLIIRTAIVGVRKRLPGFPKRLYVEDVVTLGTPHNGTASAKLCGHTQCTRLRPGSGFIKWLNEASGSGQHNANGGTNWTVVGSNDDHTVSLDSATHLKAKHKIRYPKSEGIGHSDYYGVGIGTGWTYWRSTNYGGKFHKVTRSAGPIRMAYRAAYYHSRW